MTTATNNTINIKATKPKPDAKVGITLGTPEAGGKYFVRNISESSIFTGTELKVGQEVVAINGVKLEGVPDDTVYDLLTHAKNGVIAIQATDNIITVTATKPKPDAKVGITIGTPEDCKKYFVRDISESSIFARTELQVGQEVVTINGVKLKGIAVDEMHDLLANADKGVITIQANTSGASKDRYLVSFCKVRGATVKMKEYCKEVPSFLEARDVSEQKWKRIVQSFASDLVPAIRQAASMDQIFESEMEQYTGKQMNKGYIGWGQESKHERKVYMMSQQAAIQHANMAMVASNILTMANALLNSHGVMAELSFHVRTLPKFSTKQTGNYQSRIPTALVFTAI